MRNTPEFIIMGMFVVALVLAQGCATQSGSGTGETQTERIVAPAIQDIPPKDLEVTPSRSRTIQPELAARNETGLPNGSLMDALFDFDRASLRPDALSVLNGNAKRLQGESVTRLQLEGRGDDMGSAAYNLMLGERRAENVKTYLVDLGLLIDITTISYGKDRPLCSQDSSECFQKNRSVHFVVKEKE